MSELRRTTASSVAKSCPELWKSVPAPRGDGPLFGVHEMLHAGSRASDSGRREQSEVGLAKRKTKDLPYESAVLRVLKDATGPLWEEEIYRKFEIYKTGEGKVFFHEKESDTERDKYEIRWALSNLGKAERGLVKNRTRGLWEITEAGRAYLSS